MASAFTRIAALGLVALLLESSGLLLFVLGFFPVKPALNGISGTQSLAPGCDVDDVQEFNSGPEKDKRPDEEGVIVPAQYDRVVFMVIDGLPAEFVLGKDGGSQPMELKKAMPYTQHLLSSAAAVGYHAKAASPTVTMPRLKAMTSGAIAGFLDVAYNFNTQALLEDSWIGQVARAGWRMVMFGDNTWLKLFPDLFERHDGVHSFFVKDTVEVDRNVSRHLDDELVSNDWDLMVLHYLGLDHVGHLGGRSSPLMASKLKEMDDVITRIHQTLLSESRVGKRTLLVVVSDHGMTDSGNHGGATAQETDALALFVSGAWSNPTAPAFVEGFKTGTAYQVDIVPTMALLLGIPIPKNSVGALLSTLFSSLTPKQQLKALELNSWQLWRLMRASYPGSACVNELCQTQQVKGEDSLSTYQDNDELQTFCTLLDSALDLQKRWKHSGELISISDDMGVPTFEEVREGYLHFLKATSEWLARGSTEKRINFILIGSCMMLVSTLFYLLGLHKTCEVILKESTRQSGQLVTEAGPLLVKIIAIGGVCVHAASLGSSSLVEEEQYTWHFLVSTLFLVLARFSLQELREIKQNSSMKDVGSNRSFGQILQICALLLLGRALRSWHQSGVNWTHLPDVVKYLESGNPFITTVIRIICVCSVTLLCCQLISKLLPKLLQSVIVVGLNLSSGLIFMYMRFTSTPTHDTIWATWIARFAFAVLGCTSLVAFFVIPWTIPLKQLQKLSSKPSLARQYANQEPYLSFCNVNVEGAVNATGQVLVSCWCLVQLLLQQPVNAGPVLLLLLQLIMTMSIFRKLKPYQRWLPVLTMHWLGASGHFGLGNSNSLATVDVAGAYIGLASYSTILSGVLAFCITYGSPLLYMQALLLLKSSRIEDLQGVPHFSQFWLLERFALPVMLPLALNSIVVISFTGVLFIMQDHLFVWSVFSPKYLYVCMNTVAIFAGALAVLVVQAYSTLVILRRMQWTEASLKINKRD